MTRYSTVTFAYSALHSLANLWDRTGSYHNDAKRETEKHQSQMVDMLVYTYAITTTAPVFWPFLLYYDLRPHYAGKTMGTSIITICFWNDLTNSPYIHQLFHALRSLQRHLQIQYADRGHRPEPLAQPAVHVQSLELLLPLCKRGEDVPATEAQILL